MEGTSICVRGKLGGLRHGTFYSSPGKEQFCLAATSAGFSLQGTSAPRGRCGWTRRVEGALGELGVYAAAFTPQHPEAGPLSSGVLVPAQVQVRFQVKMNGSREGEAVPAAETRGGTVQAGPTGTAHTPAPRPLELDSATTPVPGQSQRGPSGEGPGVSVDFAEAPTHQPYFPRRL